MSVDIKCLSIDPLFLRRSYTQWPLFYSVHTQWPPFYHFCIKFYIKIAKFNDFVAILTENLQILPWNLHFCTLNDPHFWESTPKKPPFFWCPHRMNPFRRNLTLNAPYFCSLVGTCTSLSYLSAPPGTLMLLSRGHLYVTFIFECPPPRDSNMSAASIDTWSVSDQLLINQSSTRCPWESRPVTLVGGIDYNINRTNSIRTNTKITH